MVIHCAFHFDMHSLAQGSAAYTSAVKYGSVSNKIWLFKIEKKLRYVGGVDGMME